MIITLTLIGVVLAGGAVRLWRHLFGWRDSNKPDDDIFYQ